jgi:hypothetical protein
MTLKFINLSFPHGRTMQAGVLGRSPVAPVATRLPAGSCGCCWPSWPELAAPATSCSAGLTCGGQELDQGLLSCNIGLTMTTRLGLTPGLPPGLSEPGSFLGRPKSASGPESHKKALRRAQLTPYNSLWGHTDGSLKISRGPGPPGEGEKPKRSVGKRLLRFSGAKWLSFCSKSPKARPPAKALNS